MKYNEAEVFSLSNSEATLLQLLAAKGDLSGYEMISRVEDFGFGESLRATSIYTGLKRLEGKGFLVSRIDTKKRGRGPMPRRYRITARGIEAVKLYVIDGLSGGGAGNGKFDLALPGMALLNKDVVLHALRRCSASIESRLDAVKQKFVSRGGAELPLEEHFRHSLVHLQTEARYIGELIDRIKRRMR